MPQPDDSGTPPAADVPTNMTGTARVTPTNGSAVAITVDDRIAVAVNRTADSVSVFNLSLAGTPPTASRTALLPTGARSEPWAVVLGNDNDTAFVVLRRERAVLKITGLATQPTIASQRGATGSEPTGIAISPTGTRLYVANWVDGTVTVLNTADMSTAGTIDLNGALAASGMLGPTASGAGRAALAHPRAIAITNDGDTDDSDETAYVTEFFSQARTAGTPADDTAFDLGRQGVVYRVSLGSNAVSGPPITLAPVADTGFRDSADAVTGCFPNQLSAATINRGRLYVTSVCESPRGPVGPAGTAPNVNVNNFKTQIHAGVFVVDIASNEGVPAQGVLLNQRFQALYDSTMTPDDGANRRMPLIPNDIAFVPASNIAYVTSYGSDAVFRMRYNDDGSLAEVGSPGNKFINLSPGGMVPAGRLPAGIAIANRTPGTALVINENTRNLTTITFTTQSAVGAVAAADMPAAGSPEDRVNLGRRFFVTGLGRWSLRGQGWNSCETCHPDGLTDNVTWFFARGPRQSTSLDGTYAPDGTTQRLLNWTAIFDEVQDFENNTRGNSGGVGAVVHRVPAMGAAPSNEDRIIFDGTPPAGAQVATPTSQTGLNGAMNTIAGPMSPGNPRSVIDDWNEIDAYVRTIRAPRAPTNLVAADVTAGRTLFEQNNCGACHGTSDWTISRRFYNPSEANNAAMGLLRQRTYTIPMGFAAALNPPAAMGAAPLRFTNADPMVVGGNDQINCILRSVGTIGAPAMMGGAPAGVAPAGVLVREVRANMTTPAQGLTGFNPPSLFGMATGAPYFHAGNARTLEEMFDASLVRHLQSLSVNLCASGPCPTETRQLAAFVLSIDESTNPVSPQGALPFNPDLCPSAL